MRPSLEKVSFGAFATLKLYSATLRAVCAERTAVLATVVTAAVNRATQNLCMESSLQ